MTPHVTKELKKEAPSEFHDKLLRECLADVKRSRGVMSKYYSDWDLQDEVFRGERTLDEDDRKQALREKPVKMIVPNTYAQVMTGTSFLFLMFKQNTKMFELSPSGEEDYGTKWRDCESAIDRDWRRSRGSILLYQHLLDIFRFGTAPLEISWTKEEAKLFVVPPEREAVVNGIPISVAAPGSFQTFTKFEGNRIRNVSPYRWFPDSAFPVVDFNRGDYCASEEDYTMGGLRKLESTGEVAGVDHIQPLPNNLTEFRGGPTRMSFIIPNRWDNKESSAPVIVTKIRKRIVPNKFDLPNGKKLGEETFPILYTIWYANDNRIIRCEPAGEWHNELGYSVGQFTPDLHRAVNMGLADLIYRLQDVISWYINSHITSVRRVIQNRNVLNPAFIEMKSYDSEGDIFIRKGVGRIDPKQAIAQLPASDVTGGHMQDADILGKLMQMVTGVNDNAMGQYNSGRRSASEARVVTAGAAGRMKMHGHLVWEGGLSPIGRMMLSNSRQSLSFESFKWAIGKGLDQSPEGQQMLMQRYAEFKGTPEEIVCGDDYLVFDSTLSSEKGFMAQNIQELLSLIVQANPAAAQQLAQNISVTKLVDEMFYLRDGTPAARFKLSPEEQQQLAQAQMQQQQEARIQMQQAQQQAEMAAAGKQQELRLKQAEGMQGFSQAQLEHRQKMIQNEEIHKQKLKQAASSNGAKK